MQTVQSGPRCSVPGAHCKCLLHKRIPPDFEAWPCGNFKLVHAAVYLEHSARPCCTSAVRLTLGLGHAGSSGWSPLLFIWSTLPRTAATCWRREHRQGRTPTARLRQSTNASSHRVSCQSLLSLASHGACVACQQHMPLAKSMYADDRRSCLSRKDCASTSVCFPRL